MNRCKADTVVMTDPSGDFALTLCEAGCGWWEAALHGNLYSGGNDGLGSGELEALQAALRADGRPDLADGLLRTQSALDREDDG